MRVRDPHVVMTRRRQRAAIRDYKLLLIFGALTLIGMLATIFVQGGWEAAAVAVAIVGGGGFAVTFVALGVSTERVRWSR